MPSHATDVVPDLPLIDEKGRRATLAGLLTADKTVMFFLRAATCAVCLSHARKLTAASAEGRLSAPVLLVTPGDAKDAARVASRVGSRPNISVLASGNAHQLVGLPKRLLMQHSGTFVVTPDRRIRYARTALMPTGSYHEEDLLRAVRSTYA